MAEADSGGGLTFHPMDQFKVEPLFGDGAVHWYTPTNATLWMAIAVIVAYLLLGMGSQRRALVPGRIQSIAELAYGFVYRMIEDATGKDGVRFFPYVMTVFMFVVTCNMLGLIPGSFVPTSQFAVTVLLALAVFISITALGFVLHGAAFLKLFWVDSAPMAVRPILAVIELISYFVRPVSHSIRLGGNMMAGHAVIKVIAAFAALAVLSPVSILGISAIYALELLVAFVQAYVFTILTCVYLRDALHPGH